MSSDKLTIYFPFFDYTTELSKTKDVITYLIFKLYNILFNHLEQAKKQLKPLDAGYNKLRIHYAQTDHIRGHIFAVSTMLTRLLDNQSTPNPQTQPTSTLRLSKMLSGNQRATKPTDDEVSQYLDGDLIKIKPLQYWRKNQSRFPAIIQLTRDILSIPATGVGVKRLFNTARNICHYRRGQAETKELEQYFSLQEIKAYPEEVEVEIDSISDHKEEDIVDPKEREEIPSLDSYNHKELQPTQSLLLLQPRHSGRKQKARTNDIFKVY
ncbi:hypothetical protein N7509_011481 [Penicillium cosmopolitanum]|uniref:HAT C-terminal dimerisation domain-containing protein n=1 Tax=Penicillium cosmopolitanum TaxID=1131564 RepID=A0A9W9SHP6_9EURO|nr:uncharacterized protein N7509_011481 [Penicillium cosmopolitanum]KAJ5378362.1 hypothetical protein N7509_011481 [Penicillium cosmopolitanum]